MNTNSMLDTTQPSLALSSSCCGSVLVQYINLASNQSIRTEEVLNGPLGFPYSVSHGQTGPEISGYSFQSISGNPSGVYMEAVQMVTYYYIRNCGLVLIKSQEICTNNILDTTNVLSGQISTNFVSPYGYNGPIIPGYQLICVKGPVFGTFRRKIQTVTYYFKKNGTGPFYYVGQLWPFDIL